jgi:hypothetical protein
MRIPARPQQSTAGSKGKKIRAGPETLSGEHPMPIRVLRENERNLPIQWFNVLKMIMGPLILCSLFMSAGGKMLQGCLPG